MTGYRTKRSRMDFTNKSRDLINDANGQNGIVGFDHDVDTMDIYIYGATTMHPIVGKMTLNHHGMGGSACRKTGMCLTRDFSRTTRIAPVTLSKSAQVGLSQFLSLASLGSLASLASKGFQKSP